MRATMFSPLSPMIFHRDYRFPSCAMLPLSSVLLLLLLLPLSTMIEGSSSSGGGGGGGSRNEEKNLPPYAAVDDNGAASTTKVLVEFYGEAQCPYCRKFVQEAWPTVWNDPELMEHVQYDFVPWGNAYFSIPKCRSSSSSQSDDTTYDPKERACWYSECIDNETATAATAPSDDCFSGKVIYQHSEKEGIVDIYENCVKLHYGLKAAVDFTYCCEGPNMDDATLPTAHDLLVKCAATTTASTSTTTVIDVDLIQDCSETHGHSIEVWAAKQTPSHPGVPYVVVDGEALDDPFSIQKAICDRLMMMMMMMDTGRSDQSEGESFRLPKACTTTTTTTISAKNEEGEAVEEEEADGILSSSS